MAEDSTLRAHRPPAASGIVDADLAEINRLWTVARAVTSTAHDVNNALQVISGSVELLEDRDLDPLVRRRLDAIRSEAAKAAAAVNQLLMYTRGRPTPPREVDLRALTQNVVGMRLASTGRSRIQVIVDRGATPSCGALIDETRTAQALLSLLLSAEHHVTGRAGARINVGVARVGDAAIVTIVATSEGGEPPAGEPGSAPATALTVEGELWAAAHLAEAQGGGVSIERSAQELRLTLKVLSTQHLAPST